MMYKPYKILIFIVLSFINAHSQELIPPIQNFEPANYSAASQNWDIKVDDRGVIYSANNEGLLVFDGLNWELFPLENNSIIRSVYPHDGRIYTGSYQEFGYWERENDGCMNYTSLAPLMEEFNMQSDEFWEILAVDEAIYFRSFGAVYKYEDDQVKKLSDKFSSAMGVYKGKLVIAADKGLSYLDENGKNQILTNTSDLVNDNDITHLETYNDTLYIGTRNQLFIYSNEKLKVFPDAGLNDMLARYDLNHISVSGNDVIIGTIKSGIIHYKIRNAEFTMYNRASGLQNNTILGMDFKRDKLWLALDRGIDVIDLNSPIKFYTDTTGELGAVYDMVVHDGKYYLASNTGIYEFDANKLKQINRSEGHTWNLELVDGVLYANHNNGLFKIVNGAFIPVDTRTGSFSMTQKDSNTNEFFISNYTGISLFDSETGAVQELNPLNFPIKKVVLESPERLLAAHPYEGIYFIDLKTDLAKSEVTKVPPLDGKSNVNPQIYEINKQIILFLDSKWYKYNPFIERFEEFKEFREFSDSRLAYHDSEQLVFVKEADGSLIFTDLKGEKSTITADNFNHRQVRSNENLIRLNDSIYYLTLNDGFARINIKKLQSQEDEQWIAKPYLLEFSDELNRYDFSKNIEVPFKASRSLTLRAGLPFSQSTGLKYNLYGEDSISGKVEAGVLKLRNLDYGNYQLKLTALAAGIKDLPTTRINFRIAPPWYLSVWMKGLYIILFLLGVLIIFRFNKYKLRKHQERLEVKFEKEHHDRLNSLEKEKLLTEIDLKRKELANTTMMAAKKNEVLMEIQQELNKDKKNFSNQFRLKHLMTKINNAIKNKDEWQLFETNFNEVHEDFFKELLEQYPKLTAKDLKLCSYLKMNLSSKEIAPLMGISVRGVEVHRYRLRKKLDLDPEMNLTKFLITNF
ncbi:helix-turn-helix and ligand-binding sensor domain-containing protein [Christiangramia salexigens]|uniref:Histidine kinase n=1 Tax=Christiangramia salexigens TaxID=1913577 RepID=A0A1L3J572_9FLAO|nr:histidine kinase [Christiangramia salexigens]APG60253.1 histidine kinase [Christiangramia salexigens]